MPSWDIMLLIAVGGLQALTLFAVLALAKRQSHRGSPAAGEPSDRGADLQSLSREVADIRKLAKRAAAESKATAGLLRKTRDRMAKVVRVAASSGDLERSFTEMLDESRIREVQVDQLFPGIESVAVEIGAIDQASGHANQVDLLYVSAIARCIKARRIFEFGTFFGRTTLHLAASEHAEKIWTLDLAPEMADEVAPGPGPSKVIGSGSQGWFFRGRDEARKILQLHGDTRTFDYGPYLGKMDFVFVDAGHEYEFVKNDTEHAFRLLAPGGVIVWHDYAPKSPGLVDFFREFTLRERPLFRIANTCLVVHVDGVDDPLTAELAVSAFDTAVADRVTESSESLCRS